MPQEHWKIVTIFFRTTPNMPLEQEEGSGYTGSPRIPATAYDGMACSALWWLIMDTDMWNRPHQNLASTPAQEEGRLIAERQERGRRQPSEQSNRDWVPKRKLRKGATHIPQSTAAIANLHQSHLKMSGLKHSTVLETVIESNLKIMGMLRCYHVILACIRQGQGEGKGRTSKPGKWEFYSDQSRCRFLPAKW